MIAIFQRVVAVSPTYRWLLLALLLLLLTALFYLSTRSTIPSPVAELQQVPDTLDNRYKYNVNSLSDLVTYQDDDGRLLQVYIYWASDRRLHIVRREFPGGEFEPPLDIHAAIGNDQLELDSHNSSALGIAPNGIMFVTGNHHVDPLNLGKTRTPYDIESFYYLKEGLVAADASNTSAAQFESRPPILASDTDRITYPSFFYLNGELHFSFREQEAGENAPRFRWMIARYDSATDRWTRSAQLNTGIKLRLYISNFAVSANSKKAHVFALWRDDKAGGGTSHQRDYFHLVTEDGVNWRNYAAGIVVSEEQKLWFDNGDKTLPGYTGVQLQPSELIWDTPPDPIPVNAGVAVVDAQGNPHALVRSRSAELYHHYWNGEEWEQNTLTGWTSSSHDLIACGSGVGALLVQQNRIVYRSLSPQAASFNTPVVLAEGYTNAKYTLSVDQRATNLGYVSFLLTQTSHHKPRTVTTANPQPAWVATFSCADLESAKPFKRSSTTD